jgi:hypothetical protein
LIKRGGRGKVVFTWLKKNDLFSLLLMISVIKLILRHWQKITGFDKPDFHEVIST